MFLACNWCVWKSVCVAPPRFLFSCIWSAVLSLRLVRSLACLAAGGAQQRCECSSFFPPTSSSFLFPLELEASGLRRASAVPLWASLPRSPRPGSNRQKKKKKHHTHKHKHKNIHAHTYRLLKRTSLRKNTMELTLNRCDEFLAVKTAQGRTRGRGRSKRNAAKPQIRTRTHILCNDNEAGSRPSFEVNTVREKRALNRSG